MTDPASVEKWIDSFVQRIREHGLEHPELVGCSSEEIDAIETRYGITLPATYRAFLSRMGHSTGRIGSKELLYTDVLERTADERYNCAMLNRGGKDNPDVNYEIPSDAFVIDSDDSHPYFFAIRCNDPIDSPVFTFDYEGQAIQFTQSFESIRDFFECLLGETIRDQGELLT